MRFKIFTTKSSRIATIASVVMLSFGSAQAQIDIGSVMEAGADDASKIMGAYMAPVLRGFGAGTNQGWYNTAKPHGLGRFDITFNFNAAFVPDEDLFYDASTLGLQKLIIKPGSGPLAPTALGDDPFTNPAIFQLFESDGGTPPSQILVAEFAAPPGVGLPYSGAPTLQIAVGLIKNTEVMVRYVPTIGLGDADLGLVGFGIKHDIKQWIPVISKLPFDMSAYYGFTKFNAAYGLSVAPDTDVAVGEFTGITNNNFSDQSIDLTTTASAMGLIVSKKLLALTVYGAVNYQTSTSTFEMLGNYPINVVETSGANIGQPVYSNIEDPISFETKGANGMTGTLGMRLKLLVLTLHGSYTFAQYPIASVGVGLNIDWK